MNYLYFLLSLIISLLLFFSLFAFLYYRLRINWAKQNRRKYSYLLPSLITFLLLAFAFFELGPRLLDVIELLEGNAHNYNIDISEVRQDGHILYYQEEKMLLSPWSEELKENTLYRFTVVPHSRIVVDIEELAEPEDVSEEN